MQTSGHRIGNTKWAIAVNGENGETPRKTLELNCCYLPVVPARADQYLTGISQAFTAPIKTMLLG